MKWLALSCALGLLSNTRAADLPVTRHSFTVIAHRGAHAGAHENTLTALRHAIAIGADYAEIDVRKTADGHYVLMHDATVNRMTDGQGTVGDLPLDKIRRLRVRDVSRPGIADDFVPTLAEALAITKGRIHLYLDFKGGDRSEVLEILCAADVLNEVIIYDNLSGVAFWRALNPRLPVITSVPDQVKTPGQLEAFLHQYPVEILDGDWHSYSPELIVSARSAAVKVWPDIQQDTESDDYYARVLSLNFDGAQSDHPRGFIRWLERNGRR